MSKLTSRDAQNLGPHTADQFHSGDPYEVSRGRKINCAPTGGDGTGPNLRGGFVVDTDPKVTRAGVDPGFEFGPFTMRAPDVAVGDFPETPGWIREVPPLAIEYASVGQDGDALREKIEDLKRVGVRHLWVVRLTEPRCVEVYERGEFTRKALPGETLTAPDVLQNPVPVEALYDREAAHEVALKNLLQRRGYRDLAAVRDAGQLDTLAHQFERRLKRPLTEAERVTLRGRVTALGAERVSDVVLDYDGDPLAAWLASPDAR